MFSFFPIIYRLREATVGAAKEAVEEEAENNEDIEPEMLEILQEAAEIFGEPIFLSDS